jgi:hypothetical protein
VKIWHFRAMAIAALFPIAKDERGSVGQNEPFRWRSCEDLAFSRRRKA